MSNVLSYAQLMSGQNSLEAIKEGARLICDRRGRYADTISNDVERIKGEISVIKGLIKSIEDNSSVLDDKHKSDLLELCEKLKLSLKGYLRKSENLRDRFKNKKIKVLAFGLKSEGKSTFTRRYTGLPESVVAVKGAGVDQDKTGALSVIYHDKNYTKENPKIIVHFKTQEEILAVVNFCVRKLRVLPNFKLPNCTDSGYSTWNDLALVLDNITKKREAYQTLSLLTDGNKVVDFAALKSFLKSVFEKESNFNDVRKDSHSLPVKISELPLYNDMTNDVERRYLSVDRIEIYANLGYEGIFENFEICDTKGISAKAGGAMIVEQGLYNDINNSDAVFSIKRVGQGAQSKEFYSNLSNNIINCDEGVKPERLDNKHFAIFNLLELADKDTIDDTINTIDELNLAKCIYIGSLGDNISYEDIIIDADIFARAVIVDMLSKIVDSTKESDDLLIADCNKLIKEISENQHLLNDYLVQIQSNVSDFNEEAIILEKIAELRNAAILKLEQEAKVHDIPLQCVVCGIDDDVVMNNSGDSKDDYFDDEDDDLIDTGSSSKSDGPAYQEHLTRKLVMDDPKRDIRTFEMITAESDETVIVDVLRNRKKSDSVSDLALEYLLDKEIKAIAGSNVYMNSVKVDGSVNSLGGYIDSVSALLFRKIEDNINTTHSLPCNIDSIVELRTKVYRVVWDALKLTGLLGELSEEVLERHKYNYVMDKWYRWYTSSIKDQYSSIIVPQQSYNILIAYFNGLKHDPDSNLKSGSVVDWNRLKRAVQYAYKIYDFEGRILEKIANEELLRHNIFRALHTSLKNPAFDIDMKGIYLGRSADELYKIGIIGKAEHDRITNQYKWDILRNAREQLKTKSVTSLQNIQ